MEQLNSTTSRQVSATQNMQNLEKAIFASDARVKIRLDQIARARIGLGLLFAIPFGTYFIYHMYAPSGVMQNFRASNGAYIYWGQNFLGPAKTYQQVYRPEFYNKDQNLSLQAYSRKIQNLRAAGKLEEGVHHPTTWHWTIYTFLFKHKCKNINFI